MQTKHQRQNSAKIVHMTHPEHDRDFYTEVGPVSPHLGHFISTGVVGQILGSDLT